MRGLDNSCGIREDAVWWNGLCLRSQRCLLASWHSPCTRLFHVPGLQNERQELWTCSLSPVLLLCPSIFFQCVYISLRYFIWIMKAGNILCLQSTDYIFKGIKAFTLSCQIKSLPKWSKLMRRFVNYS